jgi:hypothetical protein
VSRVLKVTAATVTALALATGTANAVPAGAPSTTPAQHPGKVATITDRLAGQVAAELADQAVRERVVSAVASGPADLAKIAPGTALAKDAGTADQAVLAAKGLPSTSGSLLRLRLANPKARAALTRGEVPLVAVAPTDDEKTPVTAYDPSGGKVLLDPVKAPDRPVLVVEVDVAKAMPLGLKLMRSTLAAHGVRDARPATTKAAPAGGYWATKINSVRLNDDEEPWIEGDAEIYSIVGGFGLDGKAAVNIVQMPYLDDDGTTYYPNQILVGFQAYKYNLADVVMMEDDGDTNYEALAQAIADALLTITDQGVYIPLVNAILGAIPSSWWTNDPDYVDSWYTLSTATTGTLTGAAGNGTIDVSPYWVPEL